MSHGIFYKSRRWTPYSPQGRVKGDYLDIINLVLIAILIALTAFFVASEFAIVKVRSYEDRPIN